MTLNFWSSGIYLLSTEIRRYATTTDVHGIRDQIQSSVHAGQDLPAAPRKYLVVYFITAIDCATVVASCLSRQQGERCSLPWPSELQIHSTQLLTIICREGESSFIARNKKYCIKGKNQFGQTERHFLPVFTSWLVFTILGAERYFFLSVVVYILVYIYISTPISHLSFSFIFLAI